MNQLSILLLTLISISCTNQTKKDSTNTAVLKDPIKKETVDKSEKTNPKNKVYVEFEKNKDLLDIILLLPKESFSSWEWNVEDRKKWYNEIKINNYYIDNDPLFFNQKYLEPYQAAFTIVDGSWSINLYKTFDNSYIVITCDVTGDGKELNFYEFKSNKLKKYSDEISMFSNFRELVKNKDNQNNCTEQFEEIEYPFFEYNFTNKNKIEIESSWYITKEEFGDCFNANAIIYNFNPQTKKFEIEKTYWKAKNENN
ncbi:type 2 periplasmic-binding domain-containing protein [Flavobacterium urocaniciphilum]|uniref:Uncharacterized protein n=1 Tax=Flavobacterium urocaniciphilum TaxID=1299341 RepID=A0A1H8Z2R2_9FLAO|nr:hypothetical protein [Flavobacterium urocaniciphilum]SEP58632.1 hypothetical protein SAMN05444005_101447 [Flavobacterium urocaniciphilum]